MLLHRVFTIKLVLFWRFWRCNIRPKNWSRVFVVIFILFGVPQHPAQELKSSLRANSRTFRRSAVVVSTSGSRTEVDYIRTENSYFSVFCKIVVVFLVFLWWCCWGGVVVILWWCFCGGGAVVSTSGPRTRTFRCFARLWWCFWSFCVGVVFVVVFLRWCGGDFVVVWWCLFLWWCGGVFVVVWWCFCGGVVVFVFVVVFWWWWGGVFVVLWWCFCGGVFVAVFLWWCFYVFVVVFVWWCGGVFVVVWRCFCGGVFVAHIVLTHVLT